MRIMSSPIRAKVEMTLQSMSALKERLPQAEWTGILPSRLWQLFHECRALSPETVPNMEHSCCHAK